MDLTSSAQVLKKKAVDSDGTQLELVDEKLENEQLEDEKNSRLSSSGMKALRVRNLRTGSLKKPARQQESILLIDSVTEPEENLRLTTKIGEWLEGPQDGSLLSWLFLRTTLTGEMQSKPEDEVSGSHTEPGPEHVGPVQRAGVHL